MSFLTWISNNIATIGVAIVVLGLLFLVIKKMIKDHKAGKSSCGCGCSNCSMCNMCHGHK